MTADRFVYNHDINYVKAYGNIVLTRDNQKIYGDFIQIDLNENNAMISRPILENVSVKIRLEVNPEHCGNAIVR